MSPRILTELFPHFAHPMRFSYTQRSNKYVCGLVPKQTIFTTSIDPLAWANGEQKYAKELSAFSKMGDLKFAQSPCHLPILGVTR